jgi:hypothetical protein
MQQKTNLNGTHSLSWYELEKKRLSKMKTIKIVGVPEHFNLPWHLSIEKAILKPIILIYNGLIFRRDWKMCQMLRDGETDIAVILTEGIVKISLPEITANWQVYVQPFNLGNLIAAGSKYKTLSDLENTKVAISFRFWFSIDGVRKCWKSGWNTDNLKFEIINTIDAVEA